LLATHTSSTLGDSIGASSLTLASNTETTGDSKGTDNSYFEVLIFKSLTYKTSQIFSKPEISSSN
jgi:hypothetical protein